MKNIIVKRDLCTGCEFCVTQCPTNAISMKENIAEINEECIFCGLCVPICPVSAIKITMHEHRDIDKQDWQGILVYAQAFNQGFHPVVYEMLKIAEDLSEVTGESIYLVSIGHDMDVSDLSGHKIEKIYIYDHEAYSSFRSDVFRLAMIDCIRKIKPSIVLFGATLETRVLAPNVAVDFSTGVTADCTKVFINEEGDLVQVRPAYGGNVMATIVTDHTRPQITTIRPHIFKPAVKQSYCDPEIVNCKLDDIGCESNVQIVSHQPDKREIDISHEKTVIAIGRGLKKKEDIPMFQELADLIGGRLASSRSLVEKGWMPSELQIGLSGKAIHPDLLLTFGISGSVQFQAGIKMAKEIIAINNDPDAPICSIANWSIISDIYDFAPKLMDVIQKEQSDSA